VLADVTIKTDQTILTNVSDIFSNSVAEKRPYSSAINTIQYNTIQYNTIQYNTIFTTEMQREEQTFTYKKGYKVIGGIR
jgi:hypothetical protein